MKYKITRFSQTRKEIYDHNMKVAKKMSKEMDNFSKLYPTRHQDLERQERWQQEMNKNLRSQKTSFLDRLRGIGHAVKHIGRSINSALSGPRSAITADGREVSRSILGEIGSGIASSRNQYKDKLETLKYNRALRKTGEYQESKYERRRTKGLMAIQNKYNKKFKKYEDSEEI